MIYLQNLKEYCNTFVLCIALLITTVAIVAYTEILERLDFVIYDELLSSIRYPQNSDIAIIAIDDRSLSVLGRWPWSRSIHAELIDRLRSIDNKRLAIDILFQDQQRDARADQSLAAAIAAHGHVILPLVPTSTSQSESLYLSAPYPLLRKHAVLGHADVEIDSDGIVRRVYLFAGINEPTWPAIAWALANPEKTQQEHFLNRANEEIGDRPRHWFRTKEALIPYTVQTGNYQQVSYVDVLFNDDVLSSLKNKAIIVGMTATGMGMRFATPISSINHQTMSGVAWHANIYSMLLNNLAIHPISKLWVMLISVIWVAAILIALSWTKRSLSLPLLLLTLIAGIVSIYYLLKVNHTWLPPSAAILGTLALYPLSNWQRFNQFIRSVLIAKIRSNTALESIKDGVIITDIHDTIVYINKGAEKILQSDLSQIKGKILRHILQIYSNPNTPPNDESIKNILVPSSIQSNTLECNLLTKQGDVRTVRITRNPTLDEQNVLIGSVIAITDVTDTVELAQQIAHQENYDTLTKLPNRSKLLSRFDQMIQKTHQTGSVITVFFVALDNFKKINDAMGHQAGDKLLKMVSSRLYDTVRYEDIVARWGGDEFILLFDYLNDTDSATNMAQNILNVIRQRFEIDGLEVFVSASIGISFYPKNGLTSEIVLKKAGTAMYRVKRDGGNRFDFYSSESSIVWTRDQLELEKELRTAIIGNELQVLFQPIINAKTHHITRMEALVRWPHPTRGYLSPSDFIPLAENVGLIEQLGELVLRTSCIAAHQLSQLGYPVNVSVNVNPRQLLNKDFLQTITKTLHETNLPARSLILEITESAIVNDLTRVGDILNKLKKLEILIALDDFGTGYSSLTLLRELPIDILKIDKSFVRTLDQNQNDLTIVQAIIGLGNNMGLSVIAEGVETVKQTEILLQHQCHYQQGYYYSRPIPYKALLEFFHTKNKEPHDNRIYS